MPTEPADIVAVIGAGTMGAGIALSFAQAGFSVLLVDESQAALDRALELTNANLQLLSRFGLLGDGTAATLARIELHNSIEVLTSMAKLRLVVETIPEDLKLKRRLFMRLDELPGSVIIASNTSSFTMSAITRGMRTAHRTLGLHYFNPAHIIPAVEVHRGVETTDETIASAQQIVDRAGKVSIIVRKEVPGFVINRLTGALEREIDYLLDEGIVSPEDLDKAVKASLGFRLACLGPMEAEDLIGLDVAARVSANIFKVLSNATEPSPELLEKVARGELGIKTGHGWYDYSGGKREKALNKLNTRLLNQLSLFQGEKNERDGKG